MDRYDKISLIFSFNFFSLLHSLHQDRRSCTTILTFKGTVFVTFAFESASGSGMKVFQYHSVILITNIYITRFIQLHPTIIVEHCGTLWNRIFHFIRPLPIHRFKRCYRLDIVYSKSNLNCLIVTGFILMPEAFKLNSTESFIFFSLSFIRFCCFHSMF